MLTADDHVAIISNVYI